MVCSLVSKETSLLLLKDPVFGLLKTRSDGGICHC